MKLLKRPGFVLTLACVMAVVLFVVGALRNHSLEYWYLIYNLILAIIPLGLALGVRRLFFRYQWNDWRTLGLLAVWLLFLPNSFYIVTDFIHLPETMRVDIVQDVVMLMQFSMLGLVFGFVSIFMLHALYRPLVKDKIIAPVIGAVLLLCSFAIYLGRELRWNSWDIISNPVGLLTDVADIFIHPVAHSEAFWMTGSFFIMLATLYLIGWMGFSKVHRT